MSQEISGSYTQRRRNACGEADRIRLARLFLWKEMSAIEKTSEIIRFIGLDIIITLVAGFVVALGVSIPLNLTTNTMCVIFLCAAVAALAVSIFLNVRKIRLSNKRLAEKQE